MNRNSLKNLLKIVSCLKNAEEGWLWPREIARRCNLDHKTVTRLIDRHLSNFLETQTFDPFRVHMVRLKPGVDERSVLSFLAVREKIHKK